MSTPAVSIHPYFKVHPGKMEAARALLPAFVKITKEEPARIYYEFTISGDTIFCREAYTDAEGALTHVQRVGALLEEMGKLSDIARLEIHGPAAELEKLKAPLAAFPAEWYAYECGV